MNGKTRTPLAASLLLLAALAASALPLLARGRSRADTPGRMATWTEILALVEERHVPPVDPKDAIYASIRGMLHTLDPHSNFLDEEAYREMREDQRGTFYGLGIVISKRGRYQPLRVVSPIADTPAARMGIRAGDIITHIRDERAGVDIDTMGLTIQEAVKYLRGPRGTVVEVTIHRPGLDEPLVFRVTRDAVRTPAVNQAFMVRPGIGYVHIANFTETTAAELDRALEDLSRQGAEKLLLDLTGNPGGLLDQAIAVASRFLQPGELVVYTEGRLPGSRQDYPAVSDAPRVSWPVVILVDRGSASASEIVSGALQDHDRAIIVGETTFGKGLVQSVYPLSEGCALALTTQKYFTPAGRCIQRSWASEEEYFFEVQQREPVPGPPPGAKRYRTDTGRTVFGGGGITPDVPFRAPELPEPVVRLLRVSAFSRFVTPHPDEDLARWEEHPDELLAAFREFVAREIDGVTPADLDAARDQVLLRLRAEVALARHGMVAHDRVLLEASPLVEKAIESFPEAEQLLAKRAKALARKTARAGHR